MPNILPKIDVRERPDLVQKLKSLIKKYCPEWKNSSELLDDKNLDALVQIFSNMTGNVIERLNKSPDKNLISFLNMIGVSPAPARTAKAPLVFKLSEDWERDGFIPKGAKVSAQPPNKEEVVFETEKDLTVIKPSIVRAVSIEPKDDSLSDHSYFFSTEASGMEGEIFKGDTPVPHRLYVGHKVLLNVSEPANVCMDIVNDGAGFPDVLWYCFDEDGNPCKLNSETVGNKILFRGLKGISQKTISWYDENGLLQDYTNYWIYAQLNPDALLDPEGELTKTEMLQKMPHIRDIRIYNLPDAAIKINKNGVLTIEDGISDKCVLPDIALHNDIVLDMSKDFFPFGNKPAYNDTFYIASTEAFSVKDKKITINIDFSDNKLYPIPDTKNITLSWEYWNGTGWSEIPLPDPKSNFEGLSLSASKFTDETSYIFKCPEITPCKVNGEENYWIRVRITGGNYGEDEKFEYNPVTVKYGDKDIKVVETIYTKSTLKPPLLKKFTITYSGSTVTKKSPEDTIIENNYIFNAITQNVKNSGFKPFLPCEDLEQAFYVAFDRDISSMPISLFFPLSGNQIGENPIIAWEYWNGLKWLTLSVTDYTRSFTRREMIEFTAPQDIKKHYFSGNFNYWIRGRLDMGGYITYPKMSALYSNVVWARNSNSIKDEILGSSNGEGSQTFQLSRTPVLPGQSLLVQETMGKGEWKEWEEVKTFFLSRTDSRQYMLDRASGVITFGDGKSGMIPPAGIDNIKCSYKHGGGANGNVEALSITNLWDNFPEIEGVSNPVAADGGFDQEKPEQARIRGPFTLKTQDRGVTCEDIEALTREAVPNIAKVKCIPTCKRDLNFALGKAALIIVPDSSDAKPVPSQELLGEIDEYLSERIPAVTADGASSGIDITGPDYIRVGIEANVNYTNPESSKIIEGQIIDNLKQFFNPINGGPQKSGWEFGRNVYASEVYSVIKNTPGVDYVTSASVKASTQCLTLSMDAQTDGKYYAPYLSYPKLSEVRSSDNRIVFALANPLPAKTEIKTIMVKGFEENSKISLKYAEHSEELYVLSMDGDVLQCATASGSPLNRNFPVGSDVEFQVNEDLKIRSFILNEITGRPETFFIKIALFEPRDIVLLVRSDEYVNTTPLKILKVYSEDIFLEENQLVYSGTHYINKKTLIKFPYLLDTRKKVVHDLNCTTPECYLGQLDNEDKQYLGEIPDKLDFSLCKACFPAKA